MIHLIIFALFGFVVGLISKALHPGADPIGFLPTIGIGIVGSYIGGLISWVLGRSDSAISSSGWIFSIVGGVVFCYLYSAYKTRAEKK